MCGLTEAAEITSEMTLKSKGVCLRPYSTEVFFTHRTKPFSKSVDIVCVKMNETEVLEIMKPHVNHARRRKEGCRTPCRCCRRAVIIPVFVRT